MIAARQIFLGRGGGAKLPYDAEVEYLESTGTQWIDTGVSGQASREVTCTFAFVGFPTADAAVSYIYESFASARMKFSLTANKGRGFFYSATRTTSTATTAQYDNDWHVSVGVSSPSFSAGGGEYYQKLDGEYVKGPVTSAGSDTILSSFFLFSSHNQSNVGLSKIASFAVRDTGTGEVLIDLIAVRKDGVGYMYDRVSGNLLGNGGTGDFVIGPDKI